MIASKKISQRFSSITAFFNFLWKRKLYWLIPIMAILLVFGLLLIFAQASGLGPLIYPFI